MVWDGFALFCVGTKEEHVGFLLGEGDAPSRGEHGHDVECELEGDETGSAGERREDGNVVCKERLTDGWWELCGQVVNVDEEEKGSKYRALRHASSERVFL